MSRIYIAGPMFSDAERTYNEMIAETLESEGHETFLPQRDAKDVDELLGNGMNWEEVNLHIFEEDIGGIRESDLVLFIMDGRVPDDGACVEVGYAFALGKECVGLKTDPRAFMGECDNPMIVGALKNRIARNVPEMLVILDRL
jgi:nucleoside 2-deoxyribosyltransferase